MYIKIIKYYLYFYYAFRLSCSQLGRLRVAAQATLEKDNNWISMHMCLSPSVWECVGVSL